MGRGRADCMVQTPWKHHHHLPAHEGLPQNQTRKEPGAPIGHRASGCGSTLLWDLGLGWHPLSQPGIAYACLLQGERPRIGAMNDPQSLPLSSTPAAWPGQQQQLQAHTL